MKSTTIEKKRKFHIVTYAKVVKQFNECHERFKDIRFPPSTVRFYWEKKLIEIFQKANTAKRIARVNLFVLALWATVFPTLIFFFCILLLPTHSAQIIISYEFRLKKNFFHINNSCTNIHNFLRNYIYGNSSMIMLIFWNLYLVYGNRKSHKI